MEKCLWAMMNTLIQRVEHSQGEGVTRLRVVHIVGVQMVCRGSPKGWLGQSERLVGTVRMAG